MRFTQKLATATAAAVLLACGTAAWAGVTTVNLTSDGGKSVRGLGHYAGTANYDDETGKLMITLQNTSQRGFITGLAFDIAGAATAGYADADDASSATVDEDMYDDARPGKRHDKLVRTKAFGKRETAAAINGKLRRRKGTKHGIAIGQSRSFEFDLSGSRAAGLNAQSVFGDDSSLVVAFGGLKKKRRDIVTGRMSLVTLSNDINPITDPNPNPNPNPTDVPLIDDTDNTNPGDGGNTTIPTNGGGDNGGGGPHAVPLPPAAWAGLATMALVGLNGARRRLLAGRE
jgi:hypothetical protein